MVIISVPAQCGPEADGIVSLGHSGISGSWDAVGPWSYYVPDTQGSLNQQLMKELKLKALSTLYNTGGTHKPTGRVRPGTLFLPGGSAEPLAPSEGGVTLTQSQH